MDLTKINQQVIDTVRAGGEIDGMPGMRDSLVLLTTIGRKSGQRRTAPMGKFHDGETMFVVAGNAGEPTHPNWYLNLVADPHVTVEVGGETYDAVAAPVTGAERDRLWAMFKEQHPALAGYEAKTDRTIPVIAITRI
jgi:deazaflavin-dependent oxidoreductase (nitroreductase family)